MVITLLSEEDSGKYCGQHVAVESFTSKKVIANGYDVVEVCRQAREIVDDPVIFYVPDPKVGFLFWAG